MARKNKGMINPHIKLKVFLRDELACIYCGHKGSNKNYLTIDHVLPINKGGNTHDQRNLATCCKTCNKKKTNLLLTDFLTKYKVKLNEKIARYL